MKRMIEISERMYRRLLRLYPSGHRVEYGEEMARCFRDLCRDGARRRGIAGLVVAWGLILRELPGSLIREHHSEGRIVMNKVISDKFLKDAAQILAWWGATGVLFASIFKLTSLPLTEGQLIIGLLAACAVSLQLVILGILVAPPRVASSEKP